MNSRKRLLSSVGMEQRLVEEQAEQPLLKVSDACAQKIRELLAEQERASQDQVLRITVETGGCFGFQYNFELGERDPDDVVFERDGVAVVTDPVSLELIKGSTVDYSRELIRSAFVIEKNPNAEGGCGCGVSFNVSSS
jgi:iron-sulfur cluster assembly 2